MYPPPSSELTVEQSSEQQLKSIQNNNNTNQKVYQQVTNNQNRKKNNQIYSATVNQQNSSSMGVQNRRKYYNNNTLPKVKLNIPQSRASSTENLSGHHHHQQQQQQQQQQPQQQQQQQQLTLNINGGPIQTESPTSPSYSLDYLYQVRCHMTPAGQQQQQNLSPIHYESPRFQLQQQQQRIGEHNFFNGQSNGKDGRFFNNFHQSHHHNNQSGGGGGAYHPNNNYHNNNRNHQNLSKKNQWNWNQQHAKKINNNNNSKQANNNNSTTVTPTAAAATTTTTTDNKSVTLNVTTATTANNNNNNTYQNHENLTYIRTSESSTTSSSRSIKNSRSPTPSPKSESPPTIADRDGSSSTIYSLETTPPLIESPNLTGYDSDSSHSSYRPEYYYFRNPIHQSYQLVDPSTYNLHDINEDPRSGYGMYSSHQNLLMWNQPYAAGGNSGIYQNCDFGGMRFNSVSADNVNQPKKRQSGKVSPSKHKNGKKNQNIGMNNSSVGYMYNSAYMLQSFHEPSSITPPDKFLARSFMIEVKVEPKELLTGSKWDKLSKNVWDKFMGAQQTEETYKKKMYLWRFLYLCIKKAFPRYGLFLVGSTISGFGADTSDVDMCVVTRYTNSIDPRMEGIIYLTELRNFIKSATDIFEEFHLISAKVPILRFRDSYHMLEVDLNFNNPVGVRNTHLLFSYSQMDWRLRPLALVVKLWAQHHEINNAKNMTISSYSFVLMVIHFLQCGVNPPVLPCLHAMYPQKFQLEHDVCTIDINEELEPYYSDNKQSLGELFLLFLEYYSNFDYSQYAISIRTASLLPIEKCRMDRRSLKNDIHQWKNLCIEEPFDLTNTARSVYDGEIFERVKQIFVKSWKCLLDTMDLTSVFSLAFTKTTTTTQPTL